MYAKSSSSIEAAQQVISARHYAQICGELPEEQVFRLEAALSKFSADERATLRAYEADELDQLGQLLFTSTVCSSRNRASARKDFAVKLRALERLLRFSQ
ncbi:hypothetical protein [Sphingomonas crocodyli]|uniref:Uncharacterized protein n=1 Tax=Sphingomonas crocodyli TaxID=1979270 RepID=A0A437M6L1_9SPHN|nr:hypothetical protein [Sphingomonas crocodyli]RVT93351.1 hypothetical protein EOD43_05580 [Sphingomonas crocodyli]